jgi:hypothetical protein
MHGVIFAELQSYADSKHGAGTWNALLEKANLKSKPYLPVQTYPDADVVALVAAASALTGTPISTILEDFGEFIVPDLVNMYGHLLKPEWSTIDVIDNTEKTVHSVVRVKNPGAEPPQLRTVRASKDEVSLTYRSPRRMCGLAVGIGRGLAKHFRERIAITHRTCMYKGAPECEIVFRKMG